MDSLGSRWAPPAALVGVGWLAALAAGGVTTYAAFEGDRRGAVLLGVAAIALVVVAAYGTVVRPRLAADAWGIRVRNAAGTRRLDWGEVRPRLRTTRRLGRDVTVLELETSGDDTEQLIVLGRLDLGADPRDVHDRLLAIQIGGAGQ